MESAFGKDSTADQVLEGLDLSGRRILVTGASGGLGKEVARALAARGAQLILAARNSDKLRTAREPTLCTRAVSRWRSGWKRMSAPDSAGSGAGPGGCPRWSWSISIT